MQNLLEFIKTLGAPRIAAMGAVTLALIGFFAFLILRVTTPEMTPLFTNLTLEDSASIAKELDREGVSYEIRGQGDVILVPRDRVARLRMTLAESGLPKGGGVGYEIFDKSDALGTTSFVQNINAVRALEGELERTIRTLDSVEDARVHLVMPERPLFSRDKVEPSASIVLRVRGTLDPAQVRAIRHLVATAVNGLRPQRISIVDEAGNLLADGASDDPDGGIGADERQIAYENRLRKEVEGIVDSVVGAGHARVQLTADFDFNRVTQTSDKYDPDGRVVRSSQSREETSTTTQGGANQVTVGNEIPQAPQAQTLGAPAEANAPPRDETRKTEEIVNYEISKTSRTEVIEGGRVNRVSVAVLVDGTYGKNGKGEVVYQPRSKEEIDQIAALVRSAIGFDQKRGDQVDVVNLRFAQPVAEPIEAPRGFLSALHFTTDDIMQAIEMVVMGLLALAVLLMVVRPLVRRILAPVVGPLPALPPIAPGAVVAESAAAPGVAAEPAATFKGEQSETSKMIDIAQIQGQVHAQSVQKVGEIADRNPHETVSIIRQWLHESAAA
ncbi:MAG TPA: flagellar basal-body MS-ring/collar protein FliF [Xanthobacteraceae bacterium]|nr:flagellar basal-body MS-ring/collar protein FliF [Xanthobacteraceae bacterium]